MIEIGAFLPHAALDLAISRMRNELRSRRDAVRRRALADCVGPDQIEAFETFIDAEHDRILAVAERHLRPLCVSATRDSRQSPETSPPAGADLTV